MILPKEFIHGTSPYAYIIDPGHGVETPGKRSPQLQNGYRLIEYLYTRNVASHLVNFLLKHNSSFFLTTNDKRDIPLTERVMKSEHFAQKIGKPCLFISLHGNAHGNGEEWTPASGIECWTSPGNTLADTCADIYLDQVEKLLPGWKIREDASDGDRDKEAHFFVLKHTRMPAILLEMGFYTNRSDVSMMMKDIWQKAHANVIMESILEIEKRKILG